jgi:hypothetical protein
MDFEVSPMEVCQQKQDARRWIVRNYQELTDVQAHHRLQNAVKRELYYRRHGSDADVDELDSNYDPLAEFFEYQETE